MRKYTFLLEDPELGMDVPIMVNVEAECIDDAFKDNRETLLLADRASDEGCSILQ